MQPQSSQNENQKIKASAALKIIIGGSILYFGTILTFAQLFSVTF